MSETLLAAAGAILLVVSGFLIFALCTRVDVDGGTYGMCAPARYDSYTAAPAAAPRRILAELEPPAGWHEPQHVAIVPAPARVEYDDEPAELPITVDDWPIPAIVEPEPVPVVVDRWARFSALEVQGK